jgi:hypothetical protein
VFCECGAWLNFVQLEDSLTLDELLELYSGSLKRQSRLMKTMAAAMGAEVPDDDEEEASLYSGQSSNSYNINNQKDLGFLPINLGYETIE